MEILVVDDEHLALKNICDELDRALDMTDMAKCFRGEVEENTNVHSFRDADEALGFVKQVSCDIALLDIEMKKMSGIELAKEIKEICPRINVIFTTAHSEYMETAFDIHASGYCLKPITAEKLVHEMENLRHLVVSKPRNKLVIKTFGNFEVYHEGVPIHFKYSKSKELLAYLVDRNGAMCTNRELVSILWEDDLDNHFSYLKKIRGELITRLKEIGCSDALTQQWGSIGIIPKNVDCDFFNWLNGDDSANYRGEYMTQYAWSEYTHGILEN